MSEPRGFFSLNWMVAKQSFNGWMDDRAMTLSAAIAYYTLFSLAPLLIITLAVAGLFFGEEAIRGEIFTSIRGLVGSEGAAAIEGMVKAAALNDSGPLATIIGIATLLFGATTVFAQFQDALNLIWRTKPKPGRGLWTFVRQRLLSFSLILIIGFLLLVSLLMSAALVAVGNYIQTRLPGSDVLWQGVNMAVSFGVTTLLFAAMYKLLPDVKLRWRDIGVGAMITALLFTVGKFLIGLYIGQSGIASTYGAAGSGIVILAWTYYSSAILLLGAEYTKYHTLMKGHRVLLKEGAQWLDHASPLQKDETGSSSDRQSRLAPGDARVAPA